MGKITLNDQLTETLLGKTRRAILSVLYGHADETFYVRQLVRVAGGGTGAVCLDRTGFDRLPDGGSQL